MSIDDGMSIPDPRGPKKFCGVCGSKLKERKVIAAYNEWTGEAIYMPTELVCENVNCETSPDYWPDYGW